MRAQTKFMKFYFKLPKQARRELVFDFSGKCMSLNVCYVEIYNKTELGKKVLNDLGFVDEI